MALRPLTKTQLAALCSHIALGGQLGEGGNARVFAGESKTYGSVAVKFMLNDNTKRYSRFRDEVTVVTTRLNGSSRVVPILENYLPPKLDDDTVPWYVMPRATRLMSHLQDKSWRDRVQAMLDLAQGLAELHERQVAHRDIKPDNLFELDGALRFADFGIAAFPERSGVTDLNEPMGPAHYIAPEMFSSPTTADPRKGDIYSFAKTVWVVLTEQRFPFPGQYAPTGRVALTSHLTQKRFVTEPLDTLLEASTNHEPHLRPSAEEFARRLQLVDCNN